MSHIYFAERISLINPFSENGLYDKSWVELSITDSSEYQMMTGEDKIFSFKISKRLNGSQLRVMDYISYMLLNNRNIIVTANRNDYIEAEYAYQAHTIYDQQLREYEPEILIHSTSQDSYLLIQKEGIIKSWNKIKADGKIIEENPIGSLLGDPDDFRDYIMLGGGVSTEIVVNSVEII